jgi:hypothetical protein
MISSSSLSSRMKRRIEKREVLQRAAPELRHRVGHAAERAERRGPHDQADHAEHDLRGDLEHPDDLGAHGRGERGQRGGDEEGEHEDLEHLVLHERLHEAGRQEVVGDEADQAVPGVTGLGDLLLRRRGGVPGGRGGEARAGLDQVAREQAEAERDHRRDEEVAERASRQAARLRHVPQRRDADDDRQEDHRRGDRLDELQEGVGEPLRLLRCSGGGEAEDRSGRDRHYHPEPQLRRHAATPARLDRVHECSSPREIRPRSLSATLAGDRRRRSAARHACGRIGRFGRFGRGLAAVDGTDCDDIPQRPDDRAAVDGDAETARARLGQRAAPAFAALVLDRDELGVGLGL